MTESVAQRAVELILSAVYSTRGEDGLEKRFLFGAPGAPVWNRPLSAHIFFRQRQMIHAALYVRQDGPVHLRHMSVHDIQRLLSDFVADNYSVLFRDAKHDAIDASYAERASASAKATLIRVLAASAILNPRDELTIYPLVPIKVAAEFDSQPFFLAKPPGLTRDRLGVDVTGRINSEEFPPFSDLKDHKERPAAWLGVRSPIIQASHKMKAAILGAIALTPHPIYRHQFSFRATFGGVLHIGSEKTITAFGDAHTPALSVDIEIAEGDHAWLSMLAAKLASSEPDARRELRALEYFYRAWPLDAHERFAWLFMAMDALYGDASQATQAVIEGVGQLEDLEFDYKRLRLLFGKLRASVIHGGAPDVYESASYHRYYEAYGKDPLFDLDVITSRCLRRRAFGDALIERADPYANLIRAYREGHLKK